MAALYCGKIAKDRIETWSNLAINFEKIHIILKDCFLKDTSVHWYLMTSFQILLYQVMDTTVNLSFVSGQYIRPLCNN